jgi:threonine synthase
MTIYIQYHSTNRNIASGGRSGSVTFRDALFTGLAPDGGLFMPDTIPVLSKNDFAALRGRSYPEIAGAVLGKFLQGDVDSPSLDAIVEDAFDFDVPIETLDERTSLMRLDRGPTASFKDFGARFMARMMSHLRSDDQGITVLVATSGDTGSAVGEAYRGLDGFRILILYPEHEVSPGQKQQLESIGENVRTAAVDGKFDRCQELVKRAFADPEMDGLSLTSANSINIGRLLPQIVYYVYAWLQVTNDTESIVFSVPSGNFGNSLGCEFARRMGVPIERIIIAVNENDEFPVFLETGGYTKIDPSRVCLSNAMNVGNPSNLARFFDLYGGVLTRDGVVERSPDLDEMRMRLFSTSVSDEDTVSIIKDTHERHGICLEPHGAVGVGALDRFRRSGSDTRAVCLETAHPGKFPEILEDILGIRIQPPDSFGNYAGRQRQAEHLGDDYDSFKSFLMEWD